MQQKFYPFSPALSVIHSHWTLHQHIKHVFLTSQKTNKNSWLHFFYWLLHHFFAPFSSQACNPQFLFSHSFLYQFCLDFAPPPQNCFVKLMTPEKSNSHFQYSSYLIHQQQFRINLSSWYTFFSWLPENHTFFSHHFTGISSELLIGFSCSP